MAIEGRGEISGNSPPIVYPTHLQQQLSDTQCASLMISLLALILKKCAQACNSFFNISRKVFTHALRARFNMRGDDDVVMDRAKRHAS